MQKLSEIRRLEGLRSLVGSTSTPMKAGNPKSSSDMMLEVVHTGGSQIKNLVSEHSLVKEYIAMAHIKLRRAKEEIKLLEVKLQLTVNGHAKLKVNQNEDLKLGHGFDLSSVKTSCDQLGETLWQLANKTKQAEEDNKLLEEMLGKNSKVLDEFNCLLHDLSAKLESEEQSIISEKLVKEQASFMNNLQVLRREPTGLLEGKLQAVNEHAKVKDKHIEIPELWHRLDSSMSLLKTLCNQLIEKKHELDSQTDGDPTTKKPQAEMGSKCNENISRNSSECYLMHFKKDHSTMVPFAKRSFHSTTCRNISKKKKMEHASSINDSAPGNTATIVLDPDNIPASKRSYRKAIRKVQAWCRANSKVLDLSDYFGAGAEVYTTPGKGTFHLSFQYTGRRLTFFIYGTNLYLMGWESDKLGMFEMTKKASERFIKNLSCTVLKIGLNYNDLVENGVISDVRLGPVPMMEKFDVLHKCNGISDEVKKAILVFAINISEAIRIECILQEILKSFDVYGKKFQVLTLGEVLALKAKRYGHYSYQYLRCLDYMLQGKTVPEIVNRGFNFQSVQELRIYRVPLRTAYNNGKFRHDKPDPPVWSPPYADGKDWVDIEEEDEEEEELKEENEHEEEHDHEKDLPEEEEEDATGHKLSSNGDRFPVLKMTGSLSREWNEEEEEDAIEQKLSSNGDRFPVLKMTGSLSREWNEEEEEDAIEQKLSSNGDRFPVLKMTGSLSREWNEEEEEDAIEQKLSSNGDRFPVLKMTGSLSRFAETATPGRMSCIGKYCFPGTTNATGQRMADTRSAMMKAVQVKSGQSLAHTVCRLSWRATRLFMRCLV